MEVSHLEVVDRVTSSKKKETARAKWRQYKASGEREKKKYATFSQDRCLALARTCSFVFDLNKSAAADVTTVKEMRGDETGFRVQRTALVRHQLDCEIRLLSSVKNKVGCPLKYVREDCLCFLFFFFLHFYGRRDRLSSDVH